MPATNETVITSPSADCFTQGPPTTGPNNTMIPGQLTAAGSCASSTCLRVPLEAELPSGAVYPPEGYGLSTTECDSDADCISESPCVTGFTCGVPPGLTVGPLCCQKFCVCTDYVEVSSSTGELPTPAACDPTVSANACCNLTGRAPCAG